MLLAAIPGQPNAYGALAFSPIKSIGVEKSWKLVDFWRFVGISGDECMKAFTHSCLHKGNHAGMSPCMHGWIGWFGGFLVIRGDKRR